MSTESHLAAPGYATADPSRRGAWLTMTALAVGGLASSMTLILLVPLLPQLPERIHSSPTAVSWLVTATLLGAAVTTPLGGRLGDTYGRRRVVLVVLSCLVVGSLLCALTSDFALLVVGRTLQGMSAAAIPLAISMIGTVLAPAYAALGIALVSATVAIGPAGGLPLAGVVAEHADFHVLFWLCTAIAVLGWTGVYLLVPESGIRRHGRTDLAGLVLLTGMLVTFLIPLTQVGVWGWGDGRTLGLTAGSVLLAVLFVGYEVRQANPIVDITELRRRPVALTNIASLLAGFSFFASTVGTSTFVQAPPETGYGFGSSVVVGGLCLLPTGLAALLLAPVFARMNRAVGPRPTLVTGMILIMLGFVLRIGWSDTLWQVVVGTTVTGIGIGTAYTAMPTLILQNTPPARAAAANGINTLAINVGNVLASAVSSVVLTSFTVALGRFALPSLTAYRVLFVSCAAAALLAGLIAVFIPTTGRGPVGNTHGAG